MRTLLPLLAIVLLGPQPAICQTAFCTPHPCTVENQETICGPSCFCLVAGDQVEGSCYQRPD